jgi:hypothetical protein
VVEDQYDCATIRKAEKNHIEHKLIQKNRRICNLSNYAPCHERALQNEMLPRVKVKVESICLKVST